MAEMTIGKEMTKDGVAITTICITSTDSGEDNILNMVSSLADDAHRELIIQHLLGETSLVLKFVEDGKGKIKPSLGGHPFD